MTVSEEPRRGKFVVNEKCIEKLMAFRYLSIGLQSHGDLWSTTESNQSELNNACQNYIVWKNKYLMLEAVLI